MLTDTQTQASTALQGLARLAREAIGRAHQLLDEAGIPDACLEAELLVAHVLRCRRTRVLTHPEAPLTPCQVAWLERLLQLRLKRWPLAYLTGHREFYGLELRVNRAVLIPRPETELLVDAAREQAARLAQRRGSSRLAIADVGTGSGAVAIALAKHLPDATIYATDASELALRVAAFNCRRHGVTWQVHLVHGDLLEPLPGPVDLIVANLPYVATGEFPSLMPEVRDYEPRMALDGGPDGLDVVRRLLAQAPGRLNPDGSVVLEIGAAQGAAARELAQDAFPGARVDVLSDYAGHDRIVVISNPHVHPGL